MGKIEDARNNIEKLCYNAHNIALNTFTLFAECNFEKIEYKDVKLSKDEYDIYALQFGKDLYVGSSNSLKVRIQSHFHHLRLNKHHSKRVQAAFTANGGFKAYIIMRCSETIPFAEQMIIRLLNPSLNVTPPRGRREIYNDLLWTAKHLE